MNSAMQYRQPSEYGSLLYSNSNYSANNAPVTDIKAKKYRFVVLFLICFALVGGRMCYHLPHILKTPLYLHIHDSTRHMNHEVIDDSDIDFFIRGCFYIVVFVPNLYLPYFHGCFLKHFQLDLNHSIRNASDVIVGLFSYASYFVLFGMFIQSISFATSSFYWLIIGRFLFGVGVESMLLSSLVLIVFWFKHYEMAFAFGCIVSSCLLSSAVDKLILPGLVMEYGVVAVFFSYTVICGLCTLGCLILSNLAWFVPIAKPTPFREHEGSFDFVESYLKYFAVHMCDDPDTPAAELYGQVYRNNRHRARSGSGTSEQSLYGHRNHHHNHNGHPGVNIKLYLLYAVCFLLLCTISGFNEIVENMMLTKFYPIHASLTVRVEYIQRVSELENVPYLLMVCAAPLIGLLIDKCGHTPVWLLCACCLLAATQIMFIFSDYGVCMPLIVYGTAVVMFFCAVGFLIPHICRKCIDACVIFGTILCVNNLSAIFMPMALHIIGGYDSSGTTTSMTPPSLSAQYNNSLGLFVLFSLIGSVTCCLLWYDDVEYDGGYLTFMKAHICCGAENVQEVGLNQHHESKELRPVRGEIPHIHGQANYGTLGNGHGYRAHAEMTMHHHNYGTGMKSLGQNALPASAIPLPPMDTVRPSDCEVSSHSHSHSHSPSHSRSRSRSYSHDEGCFAFDPIHPEFSGSGSYSGSHTSTPSPSVSYTSTPGIALSPLSPPPTEKTYDPYCPPETNENSASLGDRANGIAASPTGCMLNQIHSSVISDSSIGTGDSDIHISSNSVEEEVAAAIQLNSYPEAQSHMLSLQDKNHPFNIKYRGRYDNFCIPISGIFECTALSDLKDGSDCEDSRSSPGVSTNSKHSMVSKNSKRTENNKETSVKVSDSENEVQILDDYGHCVDIDENVSVSSSISSHSSLNERAEALEAAEREAGAHMHKSKSSLLSLALKHSTSAGSVSVHSGTSNASSNHQSEDGYSKNNTGTKALSTGEKPYMPVKEIKYAATPKHGWSFENLKEQFEGGTGVVVTSKNSSGNDGGTSHPAVSDGEDNRSLFNPYSPPRYGSLSLNTSSQSHSEAESHSHQMGLGVSPGSRAYNPPNASHHTATSESWVDNILHSISGFSATTPPSSSRLEHAQNGNESLFISPPTPKVMDHAGDVTLTLTPSPTSSPINSGALNSTATPMSAASASGSTSDSIGSPFADFFSSFGIGTPSLSPSTSKQLKTTRTVKDTVFDDYGLGTKASKERETGNSSAGSETRHDVYSQMEENHQSKVHASGISSKQFMLMRNKLQSDGFIQRIIENKQKGGDHSYSRGSTPAFGALRRRGSMKF